MKKLFAGIVAGCALAFAGQVLAQEVLTVWWVKGFYKSEDDALFAAIKKFEDKTKVKVELSQYPVQDMIPKTVAALDAGTPPDVAYADVYDFQVTGKWAFDGKLEDISDILTPQKDAVPQEHGRDDVSVQRQDQEEGVLRVSDQAADDAHPVLEEHAGGGGIQGVGHPDGMEGLLGLLVRQGAAGAPHARPASAPTRIGQPMGVDSSDSFYSFLTYIDAYNVKLVDDNGKLLVDDPKVKAGLVSALKDYTDIRTRGCTPPSSTSWKDPDNNVAFHNSTILMTHNATISIAAKWLDDSKNEAKTPEQRAQAKKNYDELIATAGFPKKPDGSPMIYRAAVKTGVIFEGAKNKKRAKEFVAFLLQEENLQPYVEGSLGRWYPGDQERGRRARSGRPTRIARRCTTSSTRAPRRSNSPRTTSSRFSTTRTCGRRR